MTRRVIAIDSVGPTAGLFAIDDTLITWLSPIRPDTSISRYWWIQANDKLYEYAYGFGGGVGTIHPIFWDEPRVLLDFPLTQSKSWIMGESVFGYHNRRVIALDNFHVGEGNYYCAIMETKVDSLTYFETTDWYSNSGLIYSHTDYGMNYINDEIGNIIDSVYSYQDIRLNSINLVE